MYKNGKILFGKSLENVPGAAQGAAGEVPALKEVCLDLSMANRHGLISGATGSGKTVSLKVLAESFSDAGVPVFLADIKGDLGSIAQMGADEKHVTERITSMNLAADGFAYRRYPTAFWDVYGEAGMPLRTTISEMGPLLLSRVLGINDLQTDILNVVFKIADDQGLLLIDTKDLKSMLNFVDTNKKEFEADYGKISSASITAILRAVVSLETEGADHFFGEPALSITDLLQQDQGQGLISVLDCRKLILHPDMYSTLLLWMLSELYEMLPEVGDMPKPKLVFFFDEAHMLFENASRDLLQKIEQTIKLIRSKGVGIFFVTQNPSDVPDGVMGQLGNKIQHALHAYSPKDMKQVKLAAETYRANPDFDTEEAIQSLATGEAVVSFLDEKGIPQMAEKVQVLPPQSFNGACDDSLRDQLIRGNLMYSRYANAVDRDSAYEFLLRYSLGAGAGQAQGTPAPAEAGEMPYSQSQYGQPPYGQPVSGPAQTEAGQVPYSQSQYGHPQYGQQMGQTGQPQPQASSGQYGQPDYSQFTYSQPQYGQQPPAAAYAPAGDGQMSALEQARAQAKQAKAEAEAAKKEAERQIKEAQKAAEKQAKAAQKEAERQQAALQKAQEKEEKRKKQEMGRVMKTITGTVGRQVGKSIGSSVGGAFGKTLGGNVGAQLGRSLLGTLFKL